ncbi:MAG TPA: efflux RND transporter periplasmic adaptor subunit [Halothiobacillus sp.]|nr:efflux RND transporter periplasmic adaptor subunit [Halothiobacillus sp.]
MRPVASLLLILGLLAQPIAGIAADGPMVDSVVVERTTFTPTQTGYGDIRPIAEVALTAQQTGRITALSVLPGQFIKKGTVIGHLSGTAIEARRAEYRAHLLQATAAETNAARLLTIDQRTLSDQISTRQQLIRAEQALKYARTERKIAEATLNEFTRKIVLRSPINGTVTAVQYANGSLVQPGTTIARLAPTNNLHLEARFFGAPITPGMRGMFHPLGTHKPIAVQVTQVLPIDPRDGSQPALLRPIAPTAPSDWVMGVAGRVVLSRPPQTRILVPTRALILDQGRWWVLLHTARGPQRQAVTIEHSQGDDTAVLSGLKAGDRVIVEQVYRLFHRDFAQRYQQPD